MKLVDLLNVLHKFPGNAPVKVEGGVITVGRRAVTGDDGALVVKPAPGKGELGSVRSSRKGKGSSGEGGGEGSSKAGGE